MFLQLQWFSDGSLRHVNTRYVTSHYIMAVNDTPRLVVTTSDGGQYYREFGREGCMELIRLIEYTPLTF